MSVSLAEIELTSVQNIKTGEARALVKHRIPGLEGDIIQSLGRLPVAISFEGVFKGEEALSSIEKLRNKFRAHEPMAFVADITDSTDVTEVVIEDLRVWEVGGRPHYYAYAILLREYVEIVEEDVSEQIEENQNREAEQTQKDKENAIENGTIVVETRVELAEGETDYSGISVEVCDSEGNTVENITQHTDGVFRSQPLPAGEYSVMVHRE